MDHLLQLSNFALLNSDGIIILSELCEHLFYENTFAYISLFISLVSMKHASMEFARILSENGYVYC